MNALRMGIPGVGEVHAGTHVCALFSGTVERDLLLVSFMQEGLRHGDQCVVLIDGLEAASMRQRVTGTTRVGDTRRHLDMYSAPDAYLRARELTPEQSTPSLIVDPGLSADDAFPLLRAAGQMAPGPDASGARDLFRYETSVMRILAELPTVFLCMYDVQRCGAGTLASVLKIHSMVMVDGTVLHNPHSLAPAFDPNQGADGVPGYPPAPPRTGSKSGVDEWLSLTYAEIRVARLVCAGMTNRATALELTVSTHTVDAHLKHIYQKLGIHSRVELAVFSFHHASPST